MTEKNGTPPELYKRHRPQTWKEVLGQPQAVRTLVNFLKRGEVPHTLLLSGPSGTGKTTCARILASKLECGGADFEEVNAAESRGIDMVRDVKLRMGLHPRAGKCRVWLFDEAAELTDASQHALLKILEDTPPHVYFMLATSDPQGLKNTIRTRSTEIKFRNLPDGEIRRVLESILFLEKEEVPPTVIAKIIDCSDGSPRKALVFLGQVIGLESEEDQLEAVQASEVDRTADQILKLLTNTRVKWGEVGKILDSCKPEDAEGVRRRVLGYAAAILRRNTGEKAERMYKIVYAFEASFFDSKLAGLTRACYEVFGGK